MSKVHEALKRAEEERARLQQERRNGTVSAKLSDADVSSFTGSGSNEPAASAGGSRDTTVPRQVRVAESKAAGFLRYEDLVDRCAKPVWTPDPTQAVFQDPQPVGAEQFRALRTRLYGFREAASLKKLLITSALAGEGKTFVATNLAMAITREKDRRVLLIDADLRRPRLHSCLGAPLKPGLTEYLLDQATENEIVQQGDSASKLCFVAAGSGEKNPSELLSNGGFEKFLERIGTLFDWVIVDSPPCLPVADANILAGMTDGVLLVVKAKATPAAALVKARKELQKRNVIGAVLNSVEDMPAYVGYPYERDYSSKGHE